MGWDVVIEPVDVGDPGHLDRTLAHLAVRTASGRAAMGERHQPYTVAELRVDARPTTQHRCEHLVAVEHDAGQVVGAAELYFPLLDNTDHAFGQVDVLPQARRRGVGSTLVEHLIERTRAEGRRAVTIESVAATEQISEQRQDAGTAFAVQHTGSASPWPITAAISICPTVPPTWTRCWPPSRPRWRWRVPIGGTT